MNKFDLYQIELLRPLYNNNVTLHYAFFANTFPIAYHYSKLLQLIPGKRIDHKKFIKLHDWNYVFPSQSSKLEFDLTKVKRKAKEIIEEKIIDEGWEHPQNINIFYTSDIRFKNEAIKNPLEQILNIKKQFNEYEAIETVYFTTYAPRFVFLNNNLFTRGIVKPKKYNYDINNSEFKDFEIIKSDYNKLTTVLNRAKQNHINKFIVFTDLLNEAKDIFEEYDLMGGKTIFYNKEDLKTFLNFNHKDRANTLIIYYYGAPTSFDLFKKSDRYIPILLNKRKQKSGIKSVACIHYNIKENKRKIKQIKNALEKYHKNLFKVAATDKGSEYFNNIRIAYNRFAALLRHDTRFRTPESYVNCITLYNNNYVSKKKTTQPLPIIDVKARKRKLLHFHFGAGKLSIGLVLQAIKNSTMEENKVLVVVQKRKDEWAKKIQLNLDTITLKNQDKYKYEFALQGNGSNIQNRDTFILYNKLDEISTIIKDADSISYSLHSAEAEMELLDYISRINFNNKRIHLLPFENNPIVFKDLDDLEESEKEKLENFSNQKQKFSLVEIKADRICLQRSFEFGNIVEVMNENYAEILINSANEKVKNIFSPDFYGKNKNIIFSDTPERYKFLADRKKLLLNELHFILAIYEYDFLVSKKIIHWEHQYITILQSALANDPNYKIPIDTFIKLQITRILLSEDYSNDIIAKEYEVHKGDTEMLYENLLKYANNVFQRFSNSSEDLISRVFSTLSGNTKTIERKYKEIVKTIEDFFNSNEKRIKTLELLTSSITGEYRYLIEDIKSKINRIFNARIAIYNEEVRKIAKEHKFNKIEAKQFANDIENITKLK
ncbi:MAG: hypothetical protein PVF17_03020 [Ignavibacteria bacterium]|jgi:hypothetical protein